MQPAEEPVVRVHTGEGLRWPGMGVGLQGEEGLRRRGPARGGGAWGACLGRAYRGEGLQVERACRGEGPVGRRACRGEGQQQGGGPASWGWLGRSSLGVLTGGSSLPGGGGLEGLSFCQVRGFAQAF